MTHRMVRKGEPRGPNEYDSPQADSITIHDCGDPTCKSAHILLLDKDDNAIAQATVNIRMIEGMLAIILRKHPIS